MSANSKIEWTDHTFNPWIGCTKVSPGCTHCYAEARDKRLTKGGKAAHWGKGAPRQRTSAATWRNPVKWDRERAAYVEKSKQLGYGRTDNEKVFPSLCDWLDPEVPIEWLADFLVLIDSTPNLDWLLLTKRPELFVDRICEVFEFIGQDEERFLQWHGAHAIAEGWISEGPATKPPHNVWLGVSVEDQKRADERIPILLQTPAAIRFLSCEPLLGPIDLTDPLYGVLMTDDSMPRVDWVIIGGESGSNARPCNVKWIRSIVAQCKAADVPAFVKQLGSKPVSARQLGRTIDVETFIDLKHSKGGDPSEWPEDLRVREFPKQPTNERNHEEIENIQAGRRAH